MFHLFKRDDLPPRLLLYSKEGVVLKWRLYYWVHKEFYFLILVFNLTFFRKVV